MWTRALILGVIVVVSAVSGVLTWSWTLDTALGRNAEEADRRLSMAISRLEGQLDQYRRLPRVIADSRNLVDLVLDPEPGRVREADLMLQRMADVTGALDVYVMDATGLTIAASNWNRERTFKGQRFSYRPYFRRAMQGGLGVYYAIGTTSLKRGYYFAGPILDGTRIVGAIAVKVDLDSLEAVWREDRETIVFTDPDGIIFMSNRESLLFRAYRPLSPERREAILASLRYVDLDIEQLPQLSVHEAGRHEVREPPADAPRWTEAFRESGRKTVRVREAPRIELTGHVFLDAEPAFSEAATLGGLAGTITLAIGLAGLLVVQGRAALSERLSIETRANEALESKVADRTRALTAANRRLEREVEDRRKAEEALRLAQADLVQAGKLSALGQMSAAISHELNQPLLAIRSFADNARHYNENGLSEKVSGNLGQIADLTQRMARIIRNLRAFARKEEDAPVDVALDRAVDDALELLHKRLEDDDIDIGWDRPPVPVMVRGGGVRLAQVVVNIVSNAIDAMSGLEDDGRRRIEIAVRPGDPVLLSIRDTGPGFDDRTREQIFDPFFTTKSEDAGEGLGLGLSISERIVAGFGGAIRAANHPEGGAILTVELVPSSREAAA